MQLRYLFFLLSTPMVALCLPYWSYVVPFQSHKYSFYIELRKKDPPRAHLKKYKNRHTSNDRRLLQQILHQKNAVAWLLKLSQIKIKVPTLLRCYWWCCTWRLCFMPLLFHVAASLLLLPLLRVAALLHVVVAPFSGFVVPAVAPHFFHFSRLKTQLIHFAH